jgi:acyl dehydratase
VPDSPVFYDDITVGAVATARSHTLTRTDLVKYAGASGDYNPMHHDDVQAKEVGLPSVFGHGMYSAGLVATALTDYVGVGQLTRYKVRFAKQTWPGDVLTTAITVTGKRTEDGRNLVDFECELANQDGVAVVVGEATAELPVRA